MTPGGRIALQIGRMAPGMRMGSMGVAMDVSHDACALRSSVMSVRTANGLPAEE